MIKKYIALFISWLRDDKELLSVTVALIVLSGFVMLFDYGARVWCFNGAFVPYFVMRSGYYYTHRTEAWTTMQKRRFVVLAALLIIVLLNIFAKIHAEFLLLFLLLTDYLFVTNKEPAQPAN